MVALMWRFFTAARAARLDVHVGSHVLAIVRSGPGVHPYLARRVLVIKEQDFRERG